MRLVATLPLLVTALAAQSSRAELHSVTAVRHWSVSEVTRIAVEVSGSFEYKTERLHNPERVYYDILNARPHINSRRIFSEELNDRLVSKLRVAETAPGVTRIVLDLLNSAEANTSQLTNPDRLIIELRAGAPAPPVVPTVSPISPLPTILNPPRPEPPTAPLKPAPRPKTDVADAIAAPVVPEASPAELSKAARPTSKGALEVAARENASSQKSIADLENILVNVMRGDKVEESREFAGRIQESLFSFSRRNFPGTRDRGVKSAPLLVLVGAKVPSVLVEVGFLSNPREEALLHKPEYRQKLAEALFRGISRYAESLSHNQVAKAGAE